VRLNEVLDLVNRQSALTTLGAPLLATEAQEVLVARAVPVGDVADDQPGAALTAEDAALEVVVVQPCFSPA
jgi:hypothetical protein